MVWHLLDLVVQLLHLALLASPLPLMKERLFSHLVNVPNRDDLNYIYNNNHTFSNTHDLILSIVILNYQQSLLVKRAVLNTFVHEYNPDILSISETWLLSIHNRYRMFTSKLMYIPKRPIWIWGVLLACSNYLITQLQHFDTQAEAIICAIYGFMITNAR